MQPFSSPFAGRDFPPALSPRRLPRQLNPLQHQQPDQPQQPWQPLQSLQPFLSPFSLRRDSLPSLPSQGLLGLPSLQQWLQQPFSSPFAGREFPPVLSPLRLLQRLNPLLAQQLQPTQETLQPQ